MTAKMNGNKKPNNYLNSVYSGPVIAILVIGIFLSLYSHQFLRVSNFINVGNQIAINIIIAVGMTILISSGGIDLSVGANVALSGIVTALYFINTPGGGFASVGIILGLTCGLVLGVVNGLIVALLKAPPFITTLGTMGVYRGIALVWSGGRPLSGIHPGFIDSFSGFIGPFPKQALIALLVTLAGGFMLNKTVLGRVAQALGGNERTVKVSGLAVTKYKIILYALTGFTAALGGMVLTSMMAVAEPIAGQFYELDAVAVVVLGGTSLQGGKGTVLGTLLGALLLGIVRNGLNIVGVPANYQQLFIGLIIMAAVVAGSRRSMEHQR